MIANGCESCNDLLVRLDVEGTEIKGILNAQTERAKTDAELIKELKAIIQQKNAIIEQQTEYIADLQEDNHKLQSTVKMLTL